MALALKALVTKIFFLINQDIIIVMVGTTGNCLGKHKLNS